MNQEYNKPRATSASWVVGIVSVSALGILADSVIEVRSIRRDDGAPGESHLEPTSIFGTTTPMEIPPTAVVLPEVLSADDVAFHEDVWFVLDATADRIHRLNSSGELLGSFGNRGQGPGEFSGRLAAIAAHGDSIAVLEFEGRSLHLFDLDGEPVADRILRLDDCPASAVSELISSQLGLVFLVNCTQPDLREETRVMLETRSGFMRTIATRRSDIQGAAVLGGLIWSTLSAHPRGFVFGSNVDECLSVYNLQGDILESVCHDWMEPVPTPEELVDATRDRLAALPGVRWTLPESFFPFFGLFVTHDNRWIYRVAASDEPESYVLATPDQDERRLPVPRARYVFLHEAFALVGWEDLEGTRIAIHPLEER